VLGLRQRLTPYERELATLVLLLAVFCGVWAFSELADEVLEGDSRAFDEATILALREPGDRSDPLGPHWLEEGVRDVTALGGVVVLAFFTLAVAGYLWIDRKPHAAFFVVAAVGSGLAMSSLLKELFDRPRPDLVPHGAVVYTASFPSGHSLLSAVTYLTLGALLARMQRGWVLKAYVLALALLLTLVVGSSRLYLGVHWPTDVLAGWTAGSAWAILCWTIARFLQRRGQVEPES
jgi:undecaprenyl-diphosphatase